MRYCDTLAEYEAAKANGTVTDDTLVIVLEDKQLRFKGHTFDCSGADLSALATKDELTNLIDELIKDEEVIAAAFLDLKAKIEEKPSVEIEVDAELSSDSENPIQNKVVTNALAGKADASALESKVDKVEGKGLSTEDFTTALKTKLEGLNAFDPTEINNKVDNLQTQLDTLVSGDASAAIESFNEITAFLNGIEDSESLDSIIASIEQQIANKQEKIDDLDTIRSGAALGATALQEHQDISHLATKEEVENVISELIDDEEVLAHSLNELNDRVNNISEELSGDFASKEEFDTAVQTLTEADSTNQQAIENVSGSVETLNERVDNIASELSEDFATKDEVQTANDNLTNEVIDDEEVLAHAIVDLENRKMDAQQVQSMIDASIINVINTEV